MKSLFCCLACLTISMYMYAQELSPVSGEYYLTGVMETASGFKFNSDRTFEFFFSQGALDRHGKGEFAVKGNKLYLNSKPPVEQGFRLTASRTSGNKTTILVKEQNRFLLKYVLARVKAGARLTEGALDDEGMFIYEGPHADTIQLAFEFCPDRIATFTNLPKNDNFFEFTFDPSIMEYYFNNFSLDIDGTGLRGAHPLLNGKEFRYVKNEEEQ